MISNSGDIEERGIEIEELVGDWNDDQVFRRMIDFAKDFANERDKQYDAIVLKGRFAKLQKEEKKGLITQEEFDRHCKGLMYELLELKDIIIDAWVYKEAA